MELVREKSEIRIPSVNEKSLGWSPAEKIFECRGLSFEYRLGANRVMALDDVSLTIGTQDFVAISGPSGSGKSTLLNLLGMIEPLQKGDVFFDGRSYQELTEKERNWVRRFRLGFIFQNFNLIDILNAEENVEYFLGSQGLSLNERKTRVEWALKAVELWEHRFKRPHQMSGGQRQRVAIARALAKKPRVILADEPTASLDQATGQEIVKLLKRLNQTEGLTIIVSSHDPMVLEQAPKRIRLRDGRIQRDS